MLRVSSKYVLDRSTDGVGIHQHDLIVQMLLAKS
jgi:hypothetical protein